LYGSDPDPLPSTNTKIEIKTDVNVQTVPEITKKIVFVDILKANMKKRRSRIRIRIRFQMSVVNG
jgi:hypothetical protein